MGLKAIAIIEREDEEHGAKKEYLVSRAERFPRFNVGYHSVLHASIQEYYDRIAKPDSYTMNEPVGFLFLLLSGVVAVLLENYLLNEKQKRR